MNALVPFNYGGREIRVIEDDYGEPWWVAKDVCDILGLNNVAGSLLKIPEKHKGIHPMYTLGGTQKVNIIDEPGLYRLILRSDKPEAEPFMEWVTSVVLPQIRKTGSFNVQPQYVAFERKLDQLNREFQTLKKEHTMTIRTNIDAQGIKWYVAKDLCIQAGISNTAQAASVVRADNKKRSVIATTSGQQTVLLLTTEGAMEMLARSKKPAAKQLLIEHFRWVEPDPAPVEESPMVYDINVIVKSNTGFIKYIYATFDKMVGLLKAPKHRNVKGVKIGLRKLMAITLLASGVEDSQKAFKAAAKLIVDSGAYDRMGYSDRKWLKKERKTNLVLLWVDKLIRKDVLSQANRLSPEDMVLKVLTGSFKGLHAIMRDEVIIWENNTPYVYLDCHKMAEWCIRFGIAKPFDMKHKHRKITPKTVVTDIYHDLCYSLKAAAPEDTKV